MGCTWARRRFEPVEYPSFHPGKTARILLEKNGLASR